MKNNMTNTGALEERFVLSDGRLRSFDLCDLFLQIVVLLYFSLHEETACPVCWVLPEIVIQAFCCEKEFNKCGETIKYNLEKLD